MYANLCRTITAVTSCGVTFSIIIVIARDLLASCYKNSEWEVLNRNVHLKIGSLYFVAYR